MKTMVKFSGRFWKREAMKTMKTMVPLFGRFWKWEGVKEVKTMVSFSVDSDNEKQWKQWMQCFSFLVRERNTENNENNISRSWSILKERSSENGEKSGYFYGRFWKRGAMKTCLLVCSILKERNNQISESSGYRFLLDSEKYFFLEGASKYSETIILLDLKNGRTKTHFRLLNTGYLCWKHDFFRKSEKQKMEMKKENTSKYDTTRTVGNLQK